MFFLATLAVLAGYAAWHIITTLLLLASLWIILSNRCYDDVQKWAFGAMGSILGFWAPTQQLNGSFVARGELL